MKVGIVTIVHTFPNYGNRLQNYAVYKTLKMLKIESETLHFLKQKPSIKQYIKLAVNRVTGYTFNESKYFWNYQWKRSQKFNKFNDKYIPEKRVRDLKNLYKKYDYFVIGSDQVWNPSWYCDWKEKAYLLQFAKDNQKVCFSPSFGISKLPEEWRESFKNALDNISNISVREEAGANIVKELTGKTAEVLIDPTLMLNKCDWVEIEKKPRKINFQKRYILTYFLGGKSQEQQNYIRKIANENNLVIYDLLEYNQPELYSADPSEFIYLIHNAALIFTDSFHACVFSFIFEKPFQVFPRNGVENNMMSRITTLLRKFSLQRKLYGATENDLFECDYSEGYKQLKIEQNKVIRFLEKSFI